MTTVLTCAALGCNVTVSTPMGLCPKHQPAVEAETTVLEGGSPVDEATKKRFLDTAAALLHAGPAFFNGLFTKKKDITLDPDKGTTKEEKKMEKKSFSLKGLFTNVKDSKLVAGIKKASKKLWSFTKKHALKAVGGFAAVAVAGTFTTGVCAAVGVGALLYAAMELIYRTIIKKQDFVDSILNALGHGAAYASLGALVVYSVFYAAAVAGLYASQYTAIGYIYAQYFILV